MQQPRHDLSLGVTQSYGVFVLGSRRFARISAVKGRELTEAMKVRTADFDRRSFPNCWLLLIRERIEAKARRVSLGNGPASAPDAYPRNPCQEKSMTLSYSVI